MVKKLNIFMLALSLCLTACGDEAQKAPQRVGQFGDAASYRNCDIRYPSRFSAIDFASNLGAPSLLSVIAWAEGTGNCYHYSYSYKPFISFATHPGNSICAGAYCSTAAGRYQFIKATWDRIALKKGLGTFEPSNQDLGAIALIDEKQVEGYRDIYDFPRFKRALMILGPVWSSLPGAPYGQPTRSIEESWERYQKYLRDP